MAFKMRSPFRKDKEYEPQTQTRGYKSDVKKGHHTSTDIMPQTERDKASIERLEGEIESIYDNVYREAKNRGDKSAMKRYEMRMKRMKKEIENKGGEYTHINMENW
tara:strand:+ start:393 stop:710 length:318 start_codon:yes stop_codon:yes gene_type:complete